MFSNNIYYVYAYLRNKDSATAKAGTPYSTRKEAAIALNLKVGNISSCITGYQATTGGYAFRATE